MSAQTETVQRESQASPLAGDILKILRSQLRGGGAAPRTDEEILNEADAPEFIRGTDMATDLASQIRAQTPQQRQGRLSAEALGTGVGPLQREAGTSARQFVESGAPALPERLTSAIEERQETAREDALAELGEQFGQAGNLLGTPSQVGQAQLLSRLVPRQTEQLFTEQRKFGEQQLRAIDMLSRIGGRNLEPFLALAGQGIVPEDVAVKQHPLMNVLGTVAGLARGGGSLMRGINSGGTPGGPPPA